MSTLGKSITIYFMDALAVGRWEATLSNWNGVAYKIPRGMVKKCFADLTELSTPGVYFLFGRDDSTERQFIYIGEADDVLTRLTQSHTYERDKSYWTEAIVFITQDGTLEKGRVKYLENRFYTLAKEAGRYIVKNGNTPTQSQVSKHVRDLLEEFIINALLIVPALGHMAFEPITTKASEAKDDLDGLLYFRRNKGKGGNAIGKLSADGFRVLKGSYICPEIKDYAPSGILKLRKVHADVIGKDGILKEDLLFGSPSYAAAFVSGKNTNGRVEWKNKDGVPLKKLDMLQDESSTKRDSEGKRPLAPASEQCDINELFHLAGKKVAATGYNSGNGFIVCKGSGFSPMETKSCSEHVRKLRAELVAEGKVKNGIFSEDVQFSSLSTAAACLVGSSVNGKLMWLNAEGTPIKKTQV